MRLYRASDALMAHRGAIECHVFDRAMGLFDLHPTVTLYDLTNTYFEGEAGGQPKARRGHSKEKRTDCPLLTLGLVLDASGFVRRSQVFAGNVREHHTLAEMLDALNAPRAALVVMDRGIVERFAKRFEDALTKLSEGLSKPRTQKRLDKVWQRIGRLKAQSRGVAQHYAVELDTDKSGQRATAVRFTRRPVSGSMMTHPGVYCLRSNETGLDEATLWCTYFTLTDLEAVFRSLKSELGLRPIYHHKPIRADGHLFITVIAYQLVQVIRTRLRQGSENASWTTLRRILEGQQRITATFRRADGATLHVRKANVPDNDHTSSTTPLLLQQRRSAGYFTYPSRRRGRIDRASACALGSGSPRRPLRREGDRQRRGRVVRRGRPARRRAAHRTPPETADRVRLRPAGGCGERGMAAHHRRRRGAVLQARRRSPDLLARRRDALAAVRCATGRSRHRARH